VINIGVGKDVKVELLKVPFQEEMNDNNGICAAIKTTSPDGSIKQMSYTNGG
jgi:hypothetical protein